MIDLRKFIEKQDARGLVERINGSFDLDGEASRELARREQLGKIVILAREDGSETPVVSGVVGSRELMAAAMGTTPEKAVRHLARAMELTGPVNSVSDGPCLQHSVEPGKDDDLRQIVPLLRYDPGSELPYTSASIIVARSPDHGVNLSFHRMMYLGGRRFSVRVVPRHLQMILDQGGGQAQVAVIIGVHPTISLAAATSGGPELDELGMAAGLMGGLDVVELEGGLLVPAGTELVLQGRFTGELDREGPFVDLTGTLDGVRQQPVLEIDKIYHRDGFLYHSVVPGGTEHRMLMGTPQEPRILRAVENTFPRVRGVALSAGGCNWLHAVVSLERPRAGQARNVALAALGAHPSLKRVVIVDEDIDVTDAERVEWAIATRVQADRDVMIIGGARGSSLDPSRDQADNTTAKWIVDATMPPGQDRSEFMLAQDITYPDGEG